MATKSHRIKPQHTKADLTAWQVLNASGTDFAKYDIVAASDRTEGVLYDAELAIVDGTLENFALYVVDHEIYDGDLGGGRAYEQYVMPMDTSTAATGDFVYLSALSEGETTLTDTGVPIGVVLGTPATAGYAHIWPSYFRGQVDTTYSASSLSAEEDVYSGTVDNDFQFKGIKAGGGITLTSDTEDITVALSDGASSMRTWVGVQQDDNAIYLTDTTTGLDILFLPNFSTRTLRGVLACRKDSIGANNFGGLEFVITVERQDTAHLIDSVITEIPTTSPDLPASTLEIVDDGSGTAIQLKCSLASGGPNARFSATTFETTVTGLS